MFTSYSEAFFTIAREYRFGWARMTPDTPDIGDRPVWILRILHAPGGNHRRPLIGITRLMKVLFLADTILEERTGTRTDFEWRPDRFGPLDPLVYHALDQLVADGLVSKGPSSSYDGTEVALTAQGRPVAETRWNDLTEDERAALSWVKTRHALRPLAALLSFVYQRHPDMIVRSEIKDRVLGTEEQS